MERPQASFFLFGASFKGLPGFLLLPQQLGDIRRNPP
jgi:hypothetical protein